MAVSHEPSPVRTAPRPPAVDPVTTVSSEASLRDAIGAGDVAALAELFHRHGAVAYAVARAMTGSSERAEQAVLTAFVDLRRRSADPGLPRELRIEVLDATRRSAGRVTEENPSGGRPRQTHDAVSTMSPDVRDVVALAIAGGCGGKEIAAIMGVDRETVRRDLLVGLRHAAALLDLPARSGLPRTNAASLGGR